MGRTGIPPPRPGGDRRIPRGIVHATLNPADQDAVILAILSPPPPRPLPCRRRGEEPWKSLRPA